MPRPRPERPSYHLRRVGRYWRIVWWDAAAGVTRARSTGESDRARAEATLQAFIAELSAPPPVDRLTIAVILDRYLDDRRGQVRDHRRLVDACKPLAAQLGWLPIEDIRPSASKRYADARRKAGIGDGTIAKELGTLRAALRLAEAERWIDRAPTVKLPARPPPRDRWLAPHEARRLRRAAAPHIRLFIALKLATAARTAAVLALEWRHVDLERGLIHWPSGTGNKRTVPSPINRPLRWALRLYERAATSPYVVEWNGSRVGSVKKGIERAAGRAGLVDVTAGALRHTAATWMAMAGIPMDVIARYLGHGSPAITARVYAKFSPDYLAEASRALGRPPRMKPSR